MDQPYSEITGRESLSSSALAQVLINPEFKIAQGSKLVVGGRHATGLLTKCNHNDKGAKLNAVDQQGRTPLHRSAWPGYGAAMKLLVDRGAVIDAVDNNWHTACDFAEAKDGR